MVPALTNVSATQDICIKPESHTTSTVQSQMYIESENQLLHSTCGVVGEG